MPAAPPISNVEFVRASAETSLLRVELPDGSRVTGRNVVLVVRGAGLPQRLRPLPGADGEDRRLAFAIPAHLRDGRFALSVDAEEHPIVTPPERTTRDAVAAVELRRTRERLAELERALADRPVETPAFAPDPRAERLEQQLTQHRVLRARLARELDDLRDRERDVQARLEQALTEREGLEQALEAEREGSRAEQTRLAETLDAARARVQFLERRLVEVRGRDVPGDR